MTFTVRFNVGARTFPELVDAARAELHAFDPTVPAEDWDLDLDVSSTALDASGRVLMWNGDVVASVRMLRSGPPSATVRSREDDHH